MSRTSMIRTLVNNCKLVNTVSMNLIERIQNNPTLIEGYFKTTDEVFHSDYPYALVFQGLKGCFIIPMVKQLDYLKLIKPRLF